MKFLSRLLKRMRPFTVKDLFYSGQAGGWWPCVSPIGSLDENVEQIPNGAGAVLLRQTDTAKQPVMGQFPKSGIRNRSSNNMCSGIVPGSPGSLPTGCEEDVVPAWCTRTVGCDVDNDGVPFVTIRIQGTPPTSTSYAFFLMSPRNLASFGAPAKVGQTWTLRTELKLLAGSWTGPSAVYAHLAERAANGSGYISSTPSITSVGSEWEVFEASRTLTTSAVEMTDVDLRLVGVPDETIDFTLGIKLYQYTPESDVGPAQKISAIHNITQDLVPSAPMPWFNGAKSYETGVTEFGAAGNGLFAAEGENWAFMVVYCGFWDGELVAQGDDMLKLSVCNGSPKLILRGYENVSGVNLVDGKPKAISVVCSNGAVTMRIGGGSRVAMIAGTTEHEEAEIIFGKTAKGFFNPEMLIDRDPSVEEETSCLIDIASRYGPSP